jgi:hypothetical protein
VGFPSPVLQQEMQEKAVRLGSLVRQIVLLGGKAIETSLWM